MGSDSEKPIVVSRVGVPNRIRFEVFKRDKFTCQYCGKSAPEVVLNCDHIEPVALGGTPEILNLITSCRECNSGKGALRLSDGAALEKQSAMLADLEERRQQIEMMVKWRDELRGLATDTVDAIADRIGDQTGFIRNENGKSKIRRWLKDASVAEILRAADEAFDTYLSWVEDKPTQDSWELAFSRIPSVIRVQRQEGARPYLRRMLYIQGIIRNRSGAKRYQCVEYLEHLRASGADLDEMERRAKAMRRLDDFEGPYDAWLGEIGAPF